MHPDLESKHDKMTKKTKIELHEIKIEASNYGDLTGESIFFTSDLYNDIVDKKDRRNVPVLTKIKQGRYMRGMKHLLTDIKQIGPEKRLILTKGKTHKEGNNYFINQSEYQANGQAKFLGIYRDAGFEVAGSFLHQAFPSDFENPKGKISSAELKKVENEFGNVIKQLSEKTKNKKLILQETTKFIETLKDEKYALKKDIEILKELKEKSNIYFYQSKLSELQDRLTGDTKYKETSGKNSWQSWIYSNHWIFGVNYRKPIGKEKVGFNQIPDYLFPTVDGFIDILEIKLPNKNVIVEDADHAGSYRWSGDTNEAIGQVVNYLSELELHQLEIREKLERTYCKENNIEIFSIKPRAFIVIGTKEDWGEYQKEAFRKLNYCLHGIEVLTYSDLQQRGQNIVQLYADEGD